MTNPVGSFIWYELMTTDADAAARFYEPVVGWKVEGHAAPGSPMDYRMLVRSDGGNAGGLFALSDQMIAGGARPGWLGYLFVEDVDRAVAQIEADGGRTMMPAADIEVGRIALVTDPQGVPHYVMTPKAPPGKEGMDSDVYDRRAEQRVSWNELYSPDLDGAKAFYAKHYGWRFENAMPMGPMGDYCFIDHASGKGEAIGAVMQKPPQVPMGLWNFYIRVADLDAAIEAVKAGGGQVLNGPMEVPGGDRIINGMDPQGAMFSLVAAK